MVAVEGKCFCGTIFATKCVINWPQVAVAPLFSARIFFHIYLFIFCSMYFYVVLCIVCFVTFSVLFLCICVLKNCHRVATQLQLNIPYHIISYHIFCCITDAESAVIVPSFPTSTLNCGKKKVLILNLCQTLVKINVESLCFS